MKVLENLTQLEWPKILNKTENGVTRVLCIVDDCTPASLAVKAILKVFEKHNRHDTIIISDDQLLVKLMKLQFDSQLRNSKRFKVKNVIEDIKVLMMGISSDAVSFAAAFNPDVFVVNEMSLKHFQTITAAEKVVIRKGK